MTALAAGTISLVTQGATTAALAATAATGGTAPYTYQWYRSTTNGFTPGGGNLISGATALSLADSGLVPNTTYYYVIRATDSAGSPATADSAQFTYTTNGATQSPNQFAQAAQVGMLDLRFNPNTVAVQVDTTQSTPLYAGSAVKIVDSADGIPKVVGCAADSDSVLGFIIYDVKSQAFNAGDRAEIAMAGNVLYLYATATIARGVQVSLDLPATGGVRAAAGHTGDTIVGWAYDKASSPGQLIRVFVKTPSFQVV